ncbi:perakine reductase-like isoform X1 [Carex littledalei]|uniref:Perakine reductase-like isoform X1 n=1 Tax=Carex littledalei TaxID=544730 RepID=A0A833VBC5_9POAL|nr:perakine reductase-like isoform X1 [Carex littledalei]
MATSRVKLGSQGLEVSKLGFGCMGLSYAYNSPVSDDDSISIIKHAFDSGITFFVTSDVYGPHTNEILVGKALKHLPREKVQEATKFGNSRNAAGNLVICGKPDYARVCCEASLKRLEVEYIDLYYQHRIDTTIPIEETTHNANVIVPRFKVLLDLVGVPVHIWDEKKIARMVSKFGLFLVTIAPEHATNFMAVRVAVAMDDLAKIPLSMGIVVGGLEHPVRIRTIAWKKGAIYEVADFPKAPPRLHRPPSPPSPPPSE